MHLSPSTVALTACAIFVIAAVYSSVGHGGASSYLAVMMLLAVNPSEMATTALVLNVLVAGIACAAYARAGHMSFRLIWPFVVASVPAAFAGGLIHLTSDSYFLLLSVALVAAAARLWITFPKGSADDVYRTPKLGIALPAGAGIGLLSGAVGIGGGIFLSPVMMLLRWADARRVSATAACFVVVNSISGLAGRFARGGIDIGSIAPFMVAAFAGGLLGSHVGANKLSNIALRRILALVLLAAATKAVVTVLSASP